MAVWPAIPGYAAFFLTFCFWQRIRWLLGIPVVVFMDKLCITQDDQELKEKGILGLAAFLDRSSKLTVIWSITYFQRLWCAYEVSTFLRHKSKSRPVDTMPTTVAILLVLDCLSWWCIRAAHFLLEDATGQRMSLQKLPLVAIFYALLALVMLVANFYLGIQLVDDISRLPQQLAAFSIQDAHCSCCSLGHVDPKSGEAIPCDRDLVFATLKIWYGPDLPLEDALMNFNKFVRQRLAPQILKSVGGARLPLGYTLFMIGTCNLPWLFRSTILLSSGPGVELEGFGVVVWALRVCIDWAYVPMLALFNIRLKMALIVLGNRMCAFMPKLVVALLLPLVALAGISVPRAAFTQAVRATEDDSLIPGIPFLLLAGILLALFSSPPSLFFPTHAEPEENSNSEATTFSKRSEVQPDGHGLTVIEQVMEAICESLEEPNHPDDPKDPDDVFEV